MIELLVVISILSITLSFVVPRLVRTEEAELRTSARRLLYTARRLSDDALFKKDSRVLNINLDTGEYWEGEAGKKNVLPDGISLDEVVIGKNRLERGLTFVTFFPSGLRDEAAIHISGRLGKGYTVTIPALGERFEITEKP